MSKSLAIMQPYFFPYIGYFQLIKSVDEFVIYDNIKYTKKGWINRNKILINGSAEVISLPLKKDSDFLDVVERNLADSWDCTKTFRKIVSAYQKAPFFKESIDVIKDCLMCVERNLFNFLYHSIESIIDYLEIKTKIIISSTININHDLKSEDKVLEICKKQNADLYVNAIGGVGLYNKEAFQSQGIVLKFIKSNPIIYKQYTGEFIPSLSIIDVMMFNSKDKIKEHLDSYELI